MKNILKGAAGFLDSLSSEVLPFYGAVDNLRHPQRDGKASGIQSVASGVGNLFNKLLSQGLGGSF